MAKKSKNPLIIVGVIFVLLTVGVVVYALQKDDQNNQTPTSQSKHCTTYNGTIEEQCTEDYIGIPVSEAVNKAKENDLTPKTLKVDGKAQSFTDEGPAGIYFEVENDIVTGAYFQDNRPQN